MFDIGSDEAKYSQSICVCTKTLPYFIIVSNKHTQNLYTYSVVDLAI